MNLAQRVASAAVLLMASALGGCVADTIPERPEQKPKPQLVIPTCNESKKGIEELAGFYAQDAANQPPEEDEIEKEFGVEIIGDPKYVTPMDVGYLQTILGWFGREKVTGLTFVMADFPGLAGRYINSGYLHEKYGHDRACGPIIYTTSEDSTTIHELMHHTHITNPLAHSFNKEWEAIPVRIRTPDVAQTLPNSKAREVFKKYFAKNGPFGNFGFINDNSGLNILEDVATFGELGVHGFPHIVTDHRITYWDFDFSEEPYLSKIALIEKYNIAPKEFTEVMRKRIKLGSTTFAEARSDPAFFSYVPCEISALSPKHPRKVINVDGTIFAKYKPSEKGFADVIVDNGILNPDGYNVQVVYKARVAGQTIGIVSNSFEFTVNNGKITKSTDFFDGDSNFYLTPEALKKCGNLPLDPLLAKALNTKEWKKEFEYLIGLKK